MTKFQKQMLTIAAAGALTAVTALPAMAFENEFHGLFNFNSIFSNNNSPAGGAVALKANGDYNYMEQRVRLQYIAKASDDLKLVTHFEINNRYGAKDRAQQTTSPISNGSGTGVDTLGSDLDTDGVNIMTKHAYLDFNVSKNVNAKLGLQAWKDSFGGIFIDADAPGALVSTKQGNASVALGYMRYNDLASYNDKQATYTKFGDVTTDLVLADVSYSINKDTKVGFAYYLLKDESGPSAATTFDKLTLHTFGLNGSTKVSGITLSGFAAMQSGTKEKAASADVDYKGYAYNIQAATPILGGSAKAGFLYVSGNSKSTDNGAWANTGLSTFNDGGSMLIVRNNTHAATSTNSWVKGTSVSNVQYAYAGYSAPITDKLGVVANVGLGWDAQTSYNGGDFIGTEVNGEINYKLYPTLTVMAQAGYLALGDNLTYGLATQRDPYTVRLAARFSF